MSVKFLLTDELQHSKLEITASVARLRLQGLGDCVCIIEFLKMFSSLNSIFL